ncbi:MAG TPA: glycosyltransferase family 4 protein [Candidatus Bathyarchaeia archaeon]|nr:glycosyltransferase family 4 protein [Candidatus Bathyarchaeia archaeon]
MDTRSRNVLAVIYTGFVGGAERSMLDCAAAVHDRAEFFVHVACPPESAVYAESCRLGLSTHPVEFPRLEGAGDLSRLPAASIAATRCVLDLRRLIGSLNIGLVHGNGIKASVPGVVAARWSGIPFVYHVRDFPRRRLANLAVAAMARGCIAPTEFIKNALPAGGSRCAVVPNGVDPPDPIPKRGAFRMVHNIHPHAPVVTMVAQLAPWKRHDLFIDAAARVGRGHCDAVFCIAGGDITGRNATYAASLRRRASAAGLSGSILFLGHVENIPSLLADSDVLVLPSDNEPFGRVVVEAWHCGAAVVVAGGSGPAELVEDGVTGLVAEQGRTDSFAASIRLLLSDVRLRDQLARAGKVQALRYSVYTHAEAVASVYRSLIDT